MEAHPLFETIASPVTSSPSVQLEYIACLLCGGIRHQAELRGCDHLSGLEFQVVRCEDCGLHFTNPRPTLAAIGPFYATDYVPHLRPARAHRPLRKWYPFDWLKLPDRIDGAPRLLDFGCGAGHFLANVNRQGWDVVGLDASDRVVKTIREVLELRALVGSLPHDELAPNSFDLITMWHALEHVHEPVRILNEARRLLAPGGRLAIAVPNFAGWQSRWFGIDWFGLELPRHLTHFRAETLRRMLERAGLQLREIRYSRHADWLTGSAERARQNGRLSFISPVLRNKRAADVLTWLLSCWSRGDAILALAEAK